MRILPLIVFICVFTTGCYSIMTVNVGSVNRQAQSTATALAPEVQCAAFLMATIKTPDIEATAPEICRAAIDKASKEKKK